MSLSKSNRILLVIIAFNALIIIQSSLAVAENVTGDSVEVTNSVSEETETDLTTTVGMTATLEQVVLPGSELIVRPLENRHDPFLLRIIETFGHGTDHRYDFDFYALEPGTYNLIDYLIRSDGSAVDEIDPVLVRVTETLPAGQVVPTELSEPILPSLGGYQLLLIAGGVVWVLGLLALIFAGRKREQVEVRETESQLTLAERLLPLVHSARDGSLPADQRAQLERMLIGYWSQRLHLEEMSPADVMKKLKAHDEAGPLLRQLEFWLHCPDPAAPVDIAALLAPYENITEAEFPNSSVHPLDSTNLDNNPNHHLELAKAGEK
ncbi:hypothetical protein [Rubinisphaera italica]|uniref:Uncharacterized protein n=1 Tax=Rubinisphaera italica TaxID=2527969 RepID=A0A5C5XCI5_9PLAN|nr:hypothetical protein [Rubinisphaera italica]TWT60474.1 hypothetical protein Pan54_11880 [Rubinisphaera italica]